MMMHSGVNIEELAIYHYFHTPWWVEDKIGKTKSGLSRSTFKYKFLGKRMIEDSQEYFYYDALVKYLLRIVLFFHINGA